jgi:hypothetical protein
VSDKPCPKCGKGCVACFNAGKSWYDQMVALLRAHIGNEGFPSERLEAVEALEHLAASHQLMREQFAWIAREAGGDCDPDRIIRACNIALEAMEAAA